MEQREVTVVQQVSTAQDRLGAEQAAWQEERTAALGANKNQLDGKARQAAAVVEASELIL
jgi:hypothetical protein